MGKMMTSGTPENKWRQNKADTQIFTAAVTPILTKLTRMLDKRVALPAILSNLSGTNYKTRYLAAQAILVMDGRRLRIGKHRLLHIAV